MLNCRYYKIHHQLTKSAETSPHQQAVGSRLDSIPWCAHPHSTARLADIATEFGAATRLRCGADTSKCEIPQEFQPPE